MRWYNERFDCKYNPYKQRWEMMGKQNKLELRIIADTNDGDYVTSINHVTEEELSRLRPMFKQIKDFKPYKAKYMCHHNFPIGS